MQPISHHYHQKQIDHLLTAFTTLPFLMRPIMPELHIAKGQPILRDDSREDQSYLVTDGEVVILRDGWPVDLVEYGEVLDLLLWPSTTATALRDCTLVAMG